MLSEIYAASCRPLQRRRPPGRDDRPDPRPDVRSCTHEYKTTTTDSKGRRQARWHTIFKGSSFQGGLHKQFPRQDLREARCRGADASGSSDRSLAEDGSLRRTARPTRGSEFEKEFVGQRDGPGGGPLHPEHELRACGGCSTSSRRFDARSRVFVRPFSMFIAISLSRNLFEPKFGTSLLEEAYLRATTTRSNSCVGIVEDLGLNVGSGGRSRCSSAQRRPCRRESIAQARRATVLRGAKGPNAHQALSAGGISMRNRSKQWMSALWNRR